MRQYVFGGFLVALAYFGLCSFTYIEKYYGASSSYEEGTSAMPLAGGGYLVSGAYNNSGNPANWKSYLLVLGQDGDTLWTRKDLPFSGKVKPTLDNKLIFIGGNNAGQAYDTIYVTKADLTGNIIWRTQIFHPICHNTVTDVLPLADGGYLITGFFANSSCSNPTYDSFVLKLDANGNQVWEQILGGNMNEELFTIKALADGNFAAAGWTNSENGNADYWLVKLTAKGDVVWKKRFGDSNDNYCYGMDVLPDGSFMMLGYTANTELVKVDADGNRLWTKTFGTSSGSSNYKIGNTVDGGLAFLASESVNGQLTSVLRKTDVDGNVLWSKNWNARLRDFRENTNGSFVLTGYANYLPDVAVVLMDSTMFATPVADTTRAINIGNRPTLYNTHTATAQDTQATSTDNNDTTVTTGIKNSAAASYPDVKVYPNPASDKVYIEFSNPNDAEYQLQIFSITGQMVRYADHLVGNRITIERTNMPSGVYTYLLSGAGNVYAGKMIFQ